ncbi:S-layer homology domain-containing protein [Sporosarcina soli]|uniref:S-layer homology domain-containing protein n=1 Tax=Sporosarcina soli TaxID=334736 RepID=A0ABW0TJZ5_9BACL
MKKRKASKKAFLSALSLSVATGALVVSVPLATEAADKSFSDVKANMDHYDNIMDLVEKGIVQGYEDGTFKPNGKLTRAHAAKILALSLGLDTENVKDPGFKDLNNKQWHYKYVAAIANAGYFTGFEDQTFRPNTPMTRAQMAKVIALGYKLELDPAIENPFTDVSNSAWYVDHVRTLINNKVTKGKTATTFEPNDTVTRAQMASFVSRAENAGKVDKLVQEAKTEIRKIVLENSVVESDGKKLAETKFDPAGNTLTITAYDLDDGLHAIQNLGLFSDKLLDLGVNNIRVGTNDIVNIANDRAAAKNVLQKELIAHLKETEDKTNGDLAADDIKVTLFAQKDDTEFWEDFNVNLRVFIPKQ